MKNFDKKMINKDDEVDLFGLLSLLWNEKVKIFSITLGFAVFSVLYALSLSNQYKATALLAPAQQQSAGLPGSLGQLSGLASLAGVNISRGMTDESQIAQQIMKSWSFIEKFIVVNGLEVEVFAVDGWDETQDLLEINDDVYNYTDGEWLLEDDDTGELREPSSWELFKVFNRLLTVSENKKTGLVTVEIKYYSPKIAKRWLDLFVDAINSHMQKRQIDKVSANIKYLQDQIAKTPIAEMQEVFYTIIEEQIKSKMLAEASPEYAFVTVRPGMVPEEKYSPKRAQICILITFLGGVLSVTWVLVMHYLRSRM